MAQGNFSLRFAAVQQAGGLSADVAATLQWSAPLPERDGALGGGLRQLVRGQERLLAVVESLRGVLVSQRSLLMTLNDRQVLAAPAATQPAKASVLDNKPLSHLKPAIGLDTAMVELKRVLPLTAEQQRQMVEQHIKLANEPLVAPTGATATDLVRVGLAAAKAGVGVEGSGASAQYQPQQVLDFARDAALVGSGLELKVKQAGDLLLGWRSAMQLDRGQRLDLADATQHLGSGLKVSAADIGSILGRYGGNAMAAGMSPEQAAALLAALLKSGADQASAGVALAQFSQALVQGDKASPEQLAAWRELKLDPRAVARDMQTQAPQTIQSVLAALQAQPAERQGAIAAQLFADNGALQALLPRLDGLAQAFALVADKPQYASSLRDGQGAVAKAAQEAAQTPQAQWNRLDAQVDGFKSSVGSAVLADYGNSLTGAGAVLQKFGELAQMFPHVAAALAVSVAAVSALVKLKGLYTDVSDLFSLGKKPRGPQPPAGGAGGGGIRSRLGPVFSRMAGTVANLAGRSAAAVQAAGRGLGAAVSGLGTRLATMTRQASARVAASAGQLSSRLGTAMAGLATRATAMARLAAERVGSTMGRRFSGGAPRLPGGAGGKLMGKLFRPLSLIEAGVDLVQGWREGDSGKVGAAVGSVGGGLAGTYAGASTGAAIGTLIFPGVGTAIGGLLGGALGGLAGGEAGTWLGDKLGRQADRLAAPAAVSQNLAAAQAENRQINFAPVVHIHGQDQASAQQLADRVVQQLQAQWLPLMGDSLAVRRGAALTDGVA
ncbi:phage tail tape measure protein [Pseudomonas sessilinigenes]|uniref:Phage tail tape measure protein n=1 Tax=Pseudomonas sessilinigenes TaxID=658629 RepID=A0ABX8MRT1_9PSED|nr:phage tail tape measure protein [Pseudomonas sessilinigenes]AZC22978.1 Phage tail length tape-measure protein [Pseudomonas sessilinigenes]QXH42005.1 phage tail tape measure protein [Pseudomonas sessilinigenes]